MTQRAVTFQTRARTLDHLGRGQIADLPTAVTELWKNAYDAYARSVGLHIFEGNPEVATVFDDGRGMSRDDFISRWLVIGTESKLEEPLETEEERFGLAQRSRQGEKGIGRLSAAFIAPVTLVVSRKVGGRYATTIIDWRLFENPYLSLQDIRVPVEEFDNPGELRDVLPGMFRVLRENVRPEDSGEFADHLRFAWRRFSEQETAEGRGATTEDTILTGKEYDCDASCCLDEWDVFAGLVDHGTALVMIGIQEELAAWVRPGTDSDAAASAKERLNDTLTAFTDPLSKNRNEFEFEVFRHLDGRAIPILRTSDVFGLDQFRELEHWVWGSFDEAGMFTGSVRAFGKDLGRKTFVPAVPPSSNPRGKVGAFEICIGTLEQELRNTTHSPEQFESLKAQAALYGGFKIYRDGLRVMPYGRHGADFFEIEERRGRHAGREFWAYRRSFGRVGISSTGNPNLRDKAGREGLVENRALGDMKRMVVALLKDFARRYFGSASPVRKELLPGIQRQYDMARAAADRARKRRRTSLRKFLKEHSGELEAANKSVESLMHQLQAARTPEDLAITGLKIKELDSVRTELRPPPAPPKPGDLEDKYRTYRDDYRGLAAGMELLTKLQVEKEAVLGKASPQEALRTAFSRNQSLLSARVDRLVKQLEEIAGGLSSSWRKEAEEDRSLYYKTCHSLLGESQDEEHQSSLLNLLDVRYRELWDDVSLRYEAQIRALEQLDEGIDLDGALTVADNDLVQLEEQVENLNSVAQLGITVEIIGHELETLDAEARRNLQRLPESVRGTPAYKLAYESHAALTERLRFLAPMKIAGYRPREIITGGQIGDYLGEFFERRLRADRIEYEVTPAFRAVEVTDLRSRIYPAFINLVNNAAYWVTLSTERRIILDAVDDKVVVADSGPGVDPDDIERLFTLFFTRRRNGRGVGLYLAKANLAVANHRIRYAGPGDPQILTGANFIIEFRGTGDAG